MARRLRRLAALVLPLVVAASLLSIAQAVTAPAPAAQAATTASAASLFQAGDIIDDSTFYNTSTMSASQIQSFLSSEVASCKSGYTCLENYKQATTTRSADSYCSGYTGSSSESAATIVYKVAQSCGINPQVLLVTLQKEQGLVLSSAPSASAYTIAMGYACPDTAACDTSYYGFQNQVYSAARQLQVYAMNPTYFRYRAGMNNIIQYSPSASCGSTTVYIQNKATASLYNYTPYTPNAAALAAGYGTATCGAYGNRNFYLYFTSWFGNPSNWFQSSSFEGNSIAGWTRSVGTMNRSIYQNASLAQSGIDYLQMNTKSWGSALTQDVARTTKIGEQATATIWLKSATSTPFSGRLTMWGLGGTQEEAVQTFTVGSTWQQVTVTLPVRKSTHSAIRLDVNLYTLGANLQADNAALSFGQAPALQNKLANPGFEGSFANWTPGNGSINQQIYQSSLAQQGSWFAASNTAAAGHSFSQTVSQPTSAGQRWTFSVYLRSSTAKSFSGSLALWGLGGSSTIVTQVPYTVGQTWTKVEATLDIGAVIPTSLKAEVYMTTTQATSTLWLDHASLASNLLTSGSFEAGSTAGWTSSASGMNLVSYPQSAVGFSAVDGTYLGATNATTAGSSISQTVTATPAIGDTYTAEVWVRSSTSSPFTGRLALWGLGGTTEAASTSFTATSTWRLVSVELPVGAAGHTSLKFEIYEDTPNLTVYLDGAQVD